MPIPFRLAAPILAGIASLPLAAPVAAQDRPDIHVMVGLGPRNAPVFPGADRNGWGVAPVVNVWREGTPLPVETPDEGKGIRLIGERGATSAGVAFAFAPTRNDEPETAGLGKVGFAIEPGVYAETYLGPALRLRGEVRHAIGGHGALTGDLALDLVARGRDDRVLFMAGPRARFSSGKYNRRFFGIDAAQAAASGLPRYDAGGGLRAVGAMAGLYAPIHGRWGIYGFAGYDRLVNAAADSPLVRLRGNRDQITAGMALTHTFTIRR